MVDRGRFRPPPIPAVLAASAAFILTVLAVVWLFFREERPPPEPPPVEVEARGPRDEPIVVPAPVAAAVVPRVDIVGFEERIARRLAREEPPVTPLEGALRVRLLDVEWSDGEARPLLRAERIDAVLDAGELNAGAVLVLEATLYAPDVYLARRAGESRWNYERVFGRVFGEGAPAPGRNAAVEPGPAVRLRDVGVVDGRVAIRPPGPGELRFRDVDAAIPAADLSVPGEPPTVEVARLSAAATFPAPVGPLDLAVRDARVAWPDGRVVFEAGRVDADGSIVTGIAGEYVPAAPGLGLDALARVERLELEDVGFLFPEAPPEGTAEFGLAIEPLAAGGTALGLSDLVARADGSVVAGAVALEVGIAGEVRIGAVDLRLEPLTVTVLERFTGPLPYDGTLRGVVRGEAGRFAFDLRAALTAPDVREPFTAQLAGTVVLTEDGLGLRALDVELVDVPLIALRPLAPGIPLTGRISGRISLRGPPGEAPLQFDVRLAVAGGAALLIGTLDLTGPAPVYDLEGRLIGVALEELFAVEVPPVSVTARFSLAGRGFEPAAATARLTLAGRFTDWRAGPADTIALRAAVDAGTLRLDTAALRLATLELGAAGRWRFVEPGFGEVRYRIEVASLEPFAPYLPGPSELEAAGAVATTGALSGTLERPRVAGRLEGEAVRYDEWTAGRLAATYDVTFGGRIPRAQVRVSARDLMAPGGAAYDTAMVALRLEEPRFEFAAAAVRARGGELALAADGRILEDGGVDAVVRRLEVDLDDQRWALARAAPVTWRPEAGLEVRGFLLRQVAGEGRVAITGSVPPRAGAALTVEVAALPVGDVLALLGQEPVVTGDLWLEARALGPADAPRIGADFRLVGGRIGEMYATRIEGALLYEGLNLTAEATAVLDTLGAVQLAASLPVSIEFVAAPSARLLDGRPLRASLRADSLPLAGISMLTPELRDAEGTLRADVLVTGTPDAPQLGGTIQVRNGAVTLPALDQRYEEIGADVVLEDRRAVVRDLRARSDGLAVATGTVEFPTLSRPVIDLVVRFDEFRAIGVEDLEDAAVWGELRLAGDLAAPVVTGNVTLDDGNLIVPSFGGAALDEEAEAAGESPLEPVAGIEVAEPAPWFERVALDAVVVEAGEALWFVTPEARAQLGGELVLDKEAEGPLRITGELEGERGTFTLRIGPLVRRFDIVSARIRFFGTPDPNPALDVVATRIVAGPAGEPVEIRLVIGGTADAPTVAVTTAEGADIPESELLSFLLFGQPSFALADGGAPIEPVLEEAVFGVGSLAELASIELEETLIADIGLPLDYFQIRPEPGPLAGFGAPTIAFGRELAEDVFLTVNAPLAGVFGTAVGPATWTAIVHWQIDPEWALRLGVAPVSRGRLYPWLGPAFPVTNPEQQFMIELSRRWTY